MIRTYTRFKPGDLIAIRQDNPIIYYRIKSAMHSCYIMSTLFPGDEIDGLHNDRDVAASIEVIDEKYELCND